MNTLEQIALRVAEETHEAIIKGNGDGDTWSVEFARRLAAALGAQEPVGEIKHNPGGCYEGSPIPAAPYDYAEFFIAMPPPGTELFAAPPICHVPDGWIDGAIAALTSLIAAKEYKALNGKDGAYEVMRAAAWQQAYKVLAAAPEYKP